MLSGRFTFSRGSIFASRGEICGERIWLRDSRAKSSRPAAVVQPGVVNGFTRPSIYARAAIFIIDPIVGCRRISPHDSGAIGTGSVETARPRTQVAVPLEFQDTIPPEAVGTLRCIKRWKNPWVAMSGSLKGQYLIASPKLRDPNFFRTVVLLLEHGDAGAMGLIVNRPTPVNVADALKSHFVLPKTDDRVFEGGPVEPSALFILHNDRFLDVDARLVVPGVFVGSSAEVFQNVIQAAAEENSPTLFRIYAGCAGWGPEQLEGELASTDWFLLPAAEETVFARDPHLLWSELHKQALATHRLLPDVEGNPELN